MFGGVDGMDLRRALTSNCVCTDVDRRVLVYVGFHGVLLRNLPGLTSDSVKFYTEVHRAILPLFSALCGVWDREDFWLGGGVGSFRRGGCCVYFVSGRWRGECVCRGSCFVDVHRLILLHELLADAGGGGGSSSKGRENTGDCKADLIQEDRADCEGWDIRAKD